MEKWALLENFRFYAYEDKNLTKEEKALLEELFLDYCSAESSLVNLIRKMGKESSKRAVKEFF